MRTRISKAGAVRLSRLASKTSVSGGKTVARSRTVRAHVRRRTVGRALSRTASASSRKPQARSVRLQPDPSGLLIGRARACWRGRRRAEVDAVEQQFEGAVRLVAPVHLVAVQDDVPLADRRLDDGHRLIEVLLPPRPAAAQR